MKKHISIWLVILFLVGSVFPSEAASFSSLKRSIARFSQKIDSAFTNAKAAIGEVTADVKEKASSVKGKGGNPFSKALSKARSIMQSAFNMNFLSSVPVVFWRKSFNRMFDHAQNSVDNMNLEYNGELVTRDDFQDDKALHIKKSAELALHVKSLFGSSIFAYGLTLAIGGVKEIIDSSFLNPNGSRSWEDFYADMVGASAVFGEKAFDKSLNKYMGSFLKENRKVDVADSNISHSYVGTAKETSDSAFAREYENGNNSQIQQQDDLNKTLERQRLKEEYYKAVERGDAESMKDISQKLQGLR